MFLRDRAGRLCTADRSVETYAQTALVRNPEFASDRARRNIIDTVLVIQTCQKCGCGCPCRVGIRLAEKGITGIERTAFDALAIWPPPEIARLGPLGTVPILETQEGKLIRSSIAILEYLEERLPSPEMA